MSGPDYSPFFAVMGASSAMVFSGNYVSFVSVFFHVVFFFFTVVRLFCVVMSNTVAYEF